MTDPLDVLREPDGPVAPDPDFAARLRARLARALELPRGVVVSASPTKSPANVAPDQTAGQEAPVAPWRQGDVGYVSLQVPDLERAAAFYSAVLGWSYEKRSEQALHVQGQSMSIGLFGGQDRPDLFCAYAVGDADAAIERVRAAGGTAQPPADRPYGRTADCVDNQGKAFAVFTPPAADPGRRPPINGARPGDLCYLTHLVPDSARAREFYAAVLGWTFSRGNVNDGWQIQDVAPMGGLGGGRPEHVTAPMWLVDDIEAAVERVRAAGGTATDVAQRPYGLESECTDDQGSHFYLGQLEPASS